MGVDFFFSGVDFSSDADSLHDVDFWRALTFDQGSVEAIKEALRGLPQDTVALRYLLAGPGDISSSDVDLAVASQAVVLGFNVNCSSAVESLAEDKGVELRNYKVIYDLVDDMRKAMEGLLDTVEVGGCRKLSQTISAYHKLSLTITNFVKLFICTYEPFVPFYSRHSKELVHLY